MIFQLTDSGWYFFLKSGRKKESFPFPNLEDVINDILSEQEQTGIFFEACLEKIIFLLLLPES